MGDGTLMLHNSDRKIGKRGDAKPFSKLLRLLLLLCVGLSVCCFLSVHQLLFPIFLILDRSNLFIYLFSDLP